MNQNSNSVVVIRLFAPDLEERLGGVIEVAGPTNEAAAKGRELVARADTIVSVTTAEDQAAAAAVARDIRTYVASVAKARVELTQPLDRVKARFIEVERDHTGPLVAKQKELERMVADFQLAEQRRVEAEERKHREELERIEKERLALEAKARAAADKVNTEKQLERALELEAKAKAAAEQLQATLRAPLPEVSKPKGMAVRETVQWRCDDVRKLYAARPELCTLEPKASAVRAVCFPAKGATAANPDTTTVPGLALWWETAVSARRA